MRAAYALLLTLLASAVSVQASSDAADTVFRDGTIDDDYYAADGRIELDAAVAGDVVVAGGELRIGHRIDGDLVAAGGRIEVDGEVVDDLRLAGGEIRLAVRAGDDLAASGGRIELSNDSRIGGNAWLSGGELAIGGVIDGDLEAYAGKIRISAQVRGDVDLDADSIEWLPGASVGGSLRYRSPESLPESVGANVTGALEHDNTARYADRGFGLFFSLALLATGIVFYLLFPHYTVAATQRIGNDPWSCLGLGFVFTVATPLLAVLLMLILLGFWIGLVLLALYGVALLAGFILSCFYLGERGGKLIRQPVHTTGRRLIAFAAILFLLGLVQAVPLVGGLCLLLLMLFGLGAGIIQLRYVYRPTAAGA